MDVSIIIVNYKTASLIFDCIKSVIKMTDSIDYEVIVVDNNSNDDIKERLQQINDERVSLIALKDNIGFGRANNEGLKLAKGRNILFLNPDTVLLNSAINLLSHYLDSNNHVGACGGNLYDWNMKPASSFRRIFPGIKWSLSELSLYSLEKLLFRNNWMFNYSNKALTVAYISGADLMVKKEILDKVSGFDPDYFMYYEETDLCYRIHQFGYDIISIPTAKIQHLEGKSFATDPDKPVSETGLRYSEKSRTIYFKKNTGWLCRFIDRACYPLHLLFAMFLFRNKPKVLSVYKTTYAIYRNKI